MLSTTRSASRRFLSLLALAAAAALPAAATERLGDAVKPLGQRLDLELDPRRDDYRGATTIELEVVRATATIRLHAREMKLETIELAPLDAPAASAAPRRLAATAAPESVVALGDGAPIEPGRYRLSLAFEQEYDRNAVALYKTEIAGAPYLFTQFEAVDARGAFPSFDEPGFKMPYELALTIPAGFDALANTGVAGEEPRADGGRTLRFRRTPPLPVYLVALAVGTFDFVPIPGMSIPGRVVTPKGMGGLAVAAVETTPPLLAAAERWFGSPYPFDKLDLLAIPEYWFGAMENPGAITYSAELLLPGAKPSLAERRRLVKVTAHELAHMWFGDYVTMRWWDDLWLNETFADWLGDKIAEEVYPELGVRSSELGSVDRLMSSDARPSAQPIRLVDAAPEAALQTVGVAYNKGKAVLGMLEGWMGAAEFRRGVLDYVGRHAWANAASGDLWSALARATPLPVEPVLRGFVEQPGLPLVAAEPLDGGRVRLSQRRYATAGVAVPPQSWRIPVRLRAGGGGRVVERAVLLEGESVEIALDGLDTIDWLYPNADASGYYRWLLPPAALDRLAAAASALDARERYNVLGNAGALLASDDLGADGYLALLARMAGDPDPAVLDGVLDALEAIRLPLADDGRAPGWDTFVRATLAPALERFGREPRPGETPGAAILRADLLRWLGREGRDPATLAWAEREAAAVLAGTSAADAGLTDAALQLAALDGDAALYERFLARALDAAAAPNERSRYRSALASFRAPALVERTLALYPEGRVRGDELFFVFGLVDADPALRDRLLDWTIANYPRIEADLPPEFRSFLISVGGGCDLARFERAVAFFTAPGRKAPGAERRVGATGDLVRACVALRAREGEAAARFLAAHAGS